MLAILHKHFKSICLIFTSFFILSACSRDNPLSTPEPFIEQETYCLSFSPYAPVLLESIDISDFDKGIVTDPPSDSFDIENA